MQNTKAVDDVTGKTECALILVIQEFNSVEFGAPVTRCLTIKTQIPTENYNVASIYYILMNFYYGSAYKNFKKSCF